MLSTPAFFHYSHTTSADTDEQEGEMLEEERGETIAEEEQERKRRRGGSRRRRRLTTDDSPDVPTLLLPADLAQGCVRLFENLARPSVTEKGRPGMALGFATVSPVKVCSSFILTVW